MRTGSTLDHIRTTTTPTTTIETTTEDMTMRSLEEVLEAAILVSSVENQGTWLTDAGSDMSMILNQKLAMDSDIKLT